MDLVDVSLPFILRFSSVIITKLIINQSSFLLVIVPKLSAIFLSSFFLTLECEFFFTNVDVGTVMQFFKLTTILNVDYLSICKLLF